MKQPKTLASLLVLAATVASLNVATAAYIHLGDSNSDCPETPEIHAPILIEGDDDFDLPTSGVRSGSGTAEDPYIICGWSIRPEHLDGIHVEGTTAHVVIQGNSIETAFLSYSVWMWGNGETVEDLHTGIFVADAQNVVVRDNDISSLGGGGFAAYCGGSASGCLVTPWSFGMVADQSPGIHIDGNEVEDIYGLQILVRGSPGLTLTDNVATNANVYGSPGSTIQGNDFGTDEPSLGSALHLGASPQSLVADNDFTTKHAGGLRLYDGSDDVLVEGNQITGAWTCGVCVQDASGAKLAGNNIEGNDLGVLSTDGNAVDARNNWWGCSAGPLDGACNGIDGDILVDPWATEPFPL